LHFDHRITHRITASNNHRITPRTHEGKKNMLPILEKNDPALTKATAAALESYHTAAVALNERIVKLDGRAAELAAAPAELADADEVYRPSGIGAERFRLRQAELKIRKNDLASLLAARSVDRREYAAAANEKIEPARLALVAKLCKLGFVGDGRSYDSQTKGSLQPGMIFGHPHISALRNEALDAASAANSFIDAATNVEAISDLEKLLAATVAAVAAA